MQEHYSNEQLLEALERSQKLGFLSPQPIANQITHSRDFISLIPKFKGRVLDLGAGGGLPSLVWLNIDPTLNITTIDAMKKRTDFLDEIRLSNASLIGRLEVLNGRAEALGHLVGYREKFELVVARGFGPPSITAECASGFLKPGGMLVVSGRPENESERWNPEALAEVGLSFREVRGGEISHAAVMDKVVALDSKFPRRTPAMKKSPLW